MVEVPGMAALLRVILAVVVVVGVVALLLGYWAGSSWRGTDESPARREPAADQVDRAREVGAEIGEWVATTGERIQQSANEASLTAKIKAKMALDDTVKASAIDVTTEGSTVTLSGRVASAAERARALDLARETEGVTRVVDHLQIGR
jgi:osmotically-inducible protein OsmY